MSCRTPGPKFPRSSHQNNRNGFENFATNIESYVRESDPSFGRVLCGNRRVFQLAFRIRMVYQSGRITRAVAQVLTKEEVAKLAPAEREAVGRLEAQRILADEKIVRCARASSNTVGLGLLTGVAVCLAMIGLNEPKVIPFTIPFVVMLIGLHVNRLNRRLDAIMQMLEKGTRTNGEKTVSSKIGSEMRRPNDDQEN